MKVLIHSGHWLGLVCFRGTCLHSGLFRRRFVFRIGVLKGILQLMHVYCRRRSVSSASSFFSIRVVYSIISSANCFLLSLLSSISSGISRLAATSCIMSVFSESLAYSILFPSCPRRCSAFSSIALFLSSHCACSFCFGMIISLRFGRIVLFYLVCVSIVITCVMFSHDSSVYFCICL